MKKVILYFPDTSGHNFTPPYEMLFQAKALENIHVMAILADHRTDNIYQIVDEHKSETILFVVSTLIKYSSITITKQYSDGCKIAEYVKKTSNIPILWTGLAASVMGKKILEKDYNDFILSGNSEKSFSQFLASVVSDSEYSFISNLGYKKGNQVIINSDDIFFNSFVDYGGFDLSLLKIKNYIHDNTIDYLATTGCVNDCSFCSVPVVYHGHWSHNSIDNITQHIKYLFTAFPNLMNIHFRDDNFFVNKKFIMDLFQSLKYQDLDFSWSAQTSVNVLKKYSQLELKGLKSMGCNNISIGIESGDEFILDKITKSKTSLNANIETIKKLISVGISVSVTSIISFPYNKGRDFHKTLKYLMKLKLIYPGLSMYCTILQPIPSTAIYKEIYGDDIISEDLLSNNKWTDKSRKMKLKKFENFYFIFNEKDFYRKLPFEIGQDLKIINRFFSPFIRLRFRLGLTGMLWEYSLIKKKLKAIKEKHGIFEEPFLSEVGIRHLTSNYGYGFKQ